MIWTLLSLALAQSPPSIEQHLEAHEVYAVSDGSSVFTFHRDHSFRVEPVGMSGRTIEGVWTRDDGLLLVTGVWGWVNGASKQGDHREMRMHVSPHPGEATKVGMRQVEVQPAYLTIEHLAPVDAEVFAERRGAVSP